uniref:Protein-cysteine N-palmitoyltransferase Rasp n=2 Tax=Lutzomyia longipalpis TaxID=7200 RepID=A0A1B0CD87_LUTLO
MVQYLPVGEISLYFALNFIFLFYSSYRVFSYGKLIYKENAEFGFSEGWWIIGRPKDDMDYEWHNWKNFLIEHAFWYIIHMILSQMVRLIKQRPSPFFYAAISFIFIFTRYGIIMTIAAFASAFLFYGLSRSASKVIFWAGSSIYLLALNLLKSDAFFDFLTRHTKLGESEIYEILIVFAWMLLKCISFGIDAIEHRKSRESHSDWEFCLEPFMGYVFYFPTLHLGPIMIYSRYRKSLRQEVSEVSTEKILIFLRDILLSIFWMVFLEGALHFFYVNNLQTNENVVSQLDSWALYGFGYLLGQFFHIKYVIAYGIGMAFARMDDIDPPRKPKCISRIHLYSDMWKHFDHGLYEFLFRYIYCELCAKTSSVGKKLLASLLTFVFIYLWHGFYFYIFIWSLMNFLCLTVESFARQISKTPTYRRFIQEHFNQTWEYRWNGALGTLLLVPAVISNFFFLASYDVGIIFVQRTFCSGFLHYLCVFG